MKIFVTVGNHPIPFTRLFNKIEELSCTTAHEFFVQTGRTDFVFTRAVSTPFLDTVAMQDRLQSSDLVITHGGWGTIEECLEQNLKVIAVPKIIGIEHGHSQEELVAALEKLGLLLVAYDINTLEQLIEKSLTFKPQRFIKGSSAEIIKKFIDEN